MTDNMRTFTDEVALGRPRSALAVLVPILKEMREELDELKGVKHAPTVGAGKPKTNTRKTATSKEEPQEADSTKE